VVPFRRASIPAGDVESQLVVTGVAVEKLDIPKHSMILEENKWSVALDKSVLGHPDATLFWRSSRI
jgi:hypothetical protein